MDQYYDYKPGSVSAKILQDMRLEEQLKKKAELRDKLAESAKAKKIKNK